MPSATLKMNVTGIKDGPPWRTGWDIGGLVNMSFSSVFILKKIKDKKKKHSERR